jgi:branched-chain amino acid transport system substrate-binding protein
MLALLAACGGNDGSSGGSGSGTVTLGVLAPLTGAVAGNAEQQVNAAKLAVKQFNADGGIDGAKVQLKVYDTQLAPEVATQQAQRAVTQDKVVGLLGPYTTSEGLAVAEIADRSKIPTITGSASTEAVTQDHPYMFRVAPLSTDLAGALVETALKLDVKKAVLLYDSGGSGLAFKPLVEAAAKEQGVRLTHSIQYTLGASDVSAEVTKAANGDPDALFIAGSAGGDYGLIAKSMTEQGLDIPVLGFSPIVLPDAVQIAADAYKTLPGVYTVECADPTKPEYRKLLEEYNAEFAKVSTLPEQVLGMYDATQSMLEALKETDGKGGEALAKALEELPARVGTNGKTDAELQFSADDHDAFSTDYLSPYKMQDGEPVLDASLD